MERDGTFFALFLVFFHSFFTTPQLPSFFVAFLNFFLAAFFWTLRRPPYVFFALRRLPQAFFVDFFARRLVLFAMARAFLRLSPSRLAAFLAALAILFAFFLARLLVSLLVSLAVFFTFFLTLDVPPVHTDRSVQQRQWQLTLAAFKAAIAIRSRSVRGCGQIINSF